MGKFEDTISQDTNTTNSSHGKDADQLECKDANQLDDKKDNITVCELKDDDQLDDKKDNITACELKEDTISRDIDPVSDVNNFQLKKSEEKIIEPSFTQPKKWVYQKHPSSYFSTLNSFQKK